MILKKIWAAQIYNKLINHQSLKKKKIIKNLMMINFCNLILFCIKHIIKIFGCIELV